MTGDIVLETQETQDIKRQVFLQYSEKCQGKSWQKDVACIWFALKTESSS